MISVCPASLFCERSDTLILFSKGDGEGGPRSFAAGNGNRPAQAQGHLPGNGQPQAKAPLEAAPACDPGDRDIRVTVPENLDYGELFTDLFENFTSAHQLVQVKTVNMGSLFRLQYRVHLKHPAQEKQLLDAMRCRNGNLEISCGIPETSRQGDLL